jgi:hypothetical protein
MIADTAPRSRTPVAILGAAMAAGAAALVIADPYLSPLLPHGLWRLLYLEDSPYQLLPLTLVATVAVGLFAVGLARAGSLISVGILLLMIASQTNGFRLTVLDPLDVMLLIGFVVWLGSRFGGPQTSITIGVVAGAAAALMILNLPNMLHEKTGIFLRGNISLLRCVLMALLVPNLIRSSKAFDFAIRALMWVAVASAIIGILQFIASYFFSAYFTLIDPPDTAFKPTPIGMVMRSSALCITAQHFSGFLMLATPFMLFALTRSDAQPRDRVFVGAGLVLVLAGLLLSWNFGAIMVAAVIVGLLPFFRWPRFSIQFLVTYLLGAGVAYFSGLMELIYKLTFGHSGVAKGVSQRETLIELGFTKLYRDPWNGTGAYGMAEFSGNFWGRPVHDAYVQTMTEVGMVGGWVFIGMLLLIVTQLFLAGINAPEEGSNRLRPSLMAMLALMALMMSEPMMDNSNTWLMVGLAESAILVGQGRRSLALSKRAAMSAGREIPRRPAGAGTPRSAPAE